MLCGTVCLSGFEGDETSGVERGLNGMAPGRNWKRAVRSIGPASFGALLPRGDCPGGSDLLVRDGLMIVCDSDLHDLDALRFALGSDAPASVDAPDAEWLLRAYRTWGEDCPRRLLGEFAFAIWDSKKRRLFCATDPMRRRVLYRHIKGDRLTFASSPHALLAFPGVDRSLNELAMAEFLAASVYSIDQGTTTFYLGIDQLPGATCLSFDGDGLRLSEYWSPESVPETRLDDHACVAEYRRRLIQAVDRHMASGRRFGVMLSGGFDSTAVACIAARRLASQGRRLIGITAALPEDQADVAHDSRRHAETVARFLPNMDLHVITLGEEDVVARPEGEFNVLHRPSGGFERRFASVAAHAAKLGVDVLLTGFGGDQSATARGAGYCSDMLRRGQWRSLIVECIARGKEQKCSPWRVLVNQGVIPLIPEPLWRRYKAFRLGRSLPLALGTCRADYAVEAGAMERLEQAPLASWRPQPTIRGQSRYGLRYIMRSGSITPMDRLSLAGGVRLRHPMFDRDLIEFGLSLPPEQHVRNGRRRHIMRQAGIGLLPPQTLSRADGSDSVMPDFLERMTSAGPAMIRELDALEHNPAVIRRVDFPRLRALISSYSAARPSRSARQDAQYALRAYNAAHFIAWFERRNA
ncbi:MAG: asparagine synthase-related protein [Caulobacter sp.]|nr:asparagine synthase-related protein [Caulobacter sp.]